MTIWGDDVFRAVKRTAYHFLLNAWFCYPVAGCTASALELCIGEPTQGGAATYWDWWQAQNMFTERHADDLNPKLSKSKPRGGNSGGRGSRHWPTENTGWKSERGSEDNGMIRNKNNLTKKNASVNANWGAEDGIKASINKDKTRQTMHHVNARRWKTHAVRRDLSDLREHQVLRAAAVQAQDEADGLEELLDARPELLLLHPTGGPRVQDTRLDDEFEQVL